MGGPIANMKFPTFPLALTPFKCARLSGSPVHLDSGERLFDRKSAAYLATETRTVGHRTATVGQMDFTPLRA